MSDKVDMLVRSVRERCYANAYDAMTPIQKRKLADLFEDSTDDPADYFWHDSCKATHEHYDTIFWSKSCNDWIFGE